MPESFPQSTLYLLHDTYREDCNISVCIGSAIDSIEVEKKFDDFYQKSGSTTFPNNIIVFDITELKLYLQDYSRLYLKLEYSGSSSGNLDFTLETHSGTYVEDTSTIAGTLSAPTETISGNGTYWAHMILLT